MVENNFSLMLTTCSSMNTYIMEINQRRKEGKKAKAIYIIIENGWFQECL